MKASPRTICAQLIQQKPMERIIRIAEMAKLLGVERTTLYRRVKKKAFIQPIKSQNRTLGWPESSYINWLNTQK
jgi:predicted DNA-binding transcriptional regulator AlpA